MATTQNSEQTIKQNSHQNNPHKNESFGIALKILSVLAFAIMGGLIKYLDGSIPLGQVVFFRSAVALIPLVMFLMWASDFHHNWTSGLKTKHPWGHVIRCVIGTCAMFCAFKVLELLPLAEATALNYLNPIFLVVLAMLLLKEQVSIRRWLGVGFGIAGLLLITIPKLSIASYDIHSMYGVGLGVLTALLIAVAMLQVRQLTQMGENAGAIAFYFAITSTLMGMVVMFTSNNGMVMPQPWQWFCLIGIGFIGGLAQIAMTLAFKYAQASAVAPFDYLAIVFAVIIGFVAFDEVPEPMFWLAMPLILLGAMVAKSKR